MGSLNIVEMGGYEKSGSKIGFKLLNIPYFIVKIVIFSIPLINFSRSVIDGTLFKLAATICSF